MESVWLHSRYWVIELTNSAAGARRQTMSRRRKSCVKIFWEMSRNSTSGSRSNLLRSVGTVVVAMGSVIVTITDSVTAAAPAEAMVIILLRIPVLLR